ncbi:MAG: SDR family oxidoreductase [Xanthomonadales bacterium]|nr:SDR family oxidoreductase [Xanthomonadales bacterium]
MNFQRLLCALLLTLSGATLATESTQKAVLVTGASSGSGRVIAETLAERGYYVYAGARKQADLDALNAIDNIQAIRLDVTVQSEIDAAVEAVRAEGRGLYGLVNNAGVAVMGPLVEITASEVEFVMDVNVMGPYRVTKAFAPLIIESKGRITTTGSISGILSGPFYGPYSMSKHAMEAFTDSLAAEMAKFDVKVSIIEPGGFKSKIGTTTYQRMLANGFNFDESLYKEEWENNWMVQSSGNIDLENNVPKEIALAVIDTLESENPKTRYMIVGNRQTAERTVAKAMREMVQLNEKQTHSLTRDELIKMLDAMMAQ